jgi:tripartite-type tricarboxylate transporter receptor subunit TctC
MTRNLRSLALAAVAALSSAAAHAQAWPSRPVQVISPFPAAGPSDSAARLIGPKLQEALGQPVVLENRPGASGTVGSSAVAKAAPDGHTLLMAATSSHIAPYLLKTPSFDPMKDLAPIASVGSMPFYIMVHAATGARTLAEFIDVAKKQPGKLTYASPGNGSLAHLCFELLKSQAGINVLHVPYKGSAQAVQDVMAGHVNATCNVTPTRSDNVRVLAVTSSRRSPAMPDVPTSAQAGLPAFELALWVGLFGPNKLPPAVTERLNREMNRILAEPDMQQRLRSINVEPSPGTPEQFEKFLAADTPRWGQLIRDIGVTVD